MAGAVVSGPGAKKCHQKARRPVVSELVCLRGRPGLYEAKGIDQENGTVRVLRNIPKLPIEEHVSLETICRLNKEMAQVIGCFLSSSGGPENNAA